MSGHLTCRQFIDFLDAYIEGELSGEVREEFERHIGACGPCKCYLKTYAETVKLARACGCDEAASGPPGGCPEKLVQAILAARRVGKAAGGCGEGCPD
jgi:anti-sigma factor RsiW